MDQISEHHYERLVGEKNIWVATVRPDGRPHLTPVWFAWHRGKIYICIQNTSIKAKNLSKNPQVSISLENGSKPLILEGIVAEVFEPWPEKVRIEFQKKYDWDISADQDYDLLLEITPGKILSW